MPTLESTGTESLCVSIAGVAASINAPRQLISILSQILVHARTAPGSLPSRANLDVESDDVAWRIHGLTETSRKVLSSRSPLPQVAGAVVSSLVSDVAEVAGLSVIRAAVVEREGRAVAFVGDDWESCVTLAAHLHCRGWKLLGGDYALLGLADLTVLATRKLLYVTLSSADEFPLAYRRAVEASPWYSTPHDIAFYAVDPGLVAKGVPPWARDGRLRAVLKLDGHVAEFPSLERTAPFSLADGVRSDDLERAGVAVAEIKLGDFVTTCDLLERWLEAQLAG